MNNFIYEIPTKVYFGENNLKCNLGKEVEKYGNKVLLLYGGGSIKRSGLYEKILNKNKGIILAQENYLPTDKRGNVNVF